MNENKTINRSDNLFQTLVVWAFGAMLAAVILICAVFKNKSYAMEELCAHYPLNALLIAIGTVFVLGVYFLIRKINRINWWILGAVMLFMLIFRIFAVSSYYFYTNWDAGKITNAASDWLHSGNMIPYNYYYSWYNNNILPTEILFVIEKAADSLGLHQYEYMSVLAVQCVLFGIAGLLTVASLEALFNDARISVLGYILFELLVGMSPWVSIPYTDALGLIFPILIFYLYIRSAQSSKPFIYCIFIGFLSVAGYAIKPQALILLIAMVCMSLITLPKSGINKQKVKCAVSTFAGIVLATLSISAATSLAPFEISKDKAFGPTHFLMVGLNPDSQGVYAEDDVAYSSCFSTRQKRIKGNFYKINERLNQMGIRGTAKLFIKKTLTNYNDGTFAWGGEGGFFTAVIPSDSLISKFFRGLYYNGTEIETGKYFYAWSTFEQMLWQTILFLSILAAFAKKDRRICLLMLVIIGLTVFQTLFEARARYLFTYVPLYIILAAYGFSNTAHGLIKAKRSL